MKCEGKLIAAEYVHRGTSLLCVAFSRHKKLLKEEWSAVRFLYELVDGEVVILGKTQNESAGELNYS